MTLPHLAEESIFKSSELINIFLKSIECSMFCPFLLYSDMVVSCNYSIGDVEGIGNDKKTGRGAMKYEIQRRSTCEPEIWFTVAEAGLKIWAERMVVIETVLSVPQDEAC